jgi:hypothetical protein
VRLATLLAALAGLLASCGGGEDGARVAIASPADGATVETPVSVTMEADGFDLEPAGAVREGAGHLHLIVDGDCVSAGEQIPADETHVHLADGATETELDLAPGAHTLCLQAGDGAHTALDLTDQITITVVGAAGGTTTGTADDASSERWEGTYDGQVVWDCGPAGTHRGTLAGDVVVVTGEDGGARLEGDNTVRGSCADTGELTTPIVVAGERTPTGFRFPAETWGRPGSFELTVEGTTATGRLSGAIAGPATITIDFELECTSGC